MPLNKHIYILLFWLSMISAPLLAINTDTRSDSIDILHTHIALDFSAFSTKVLRGHADIQFKARVNNISYIRLDLLELDVDSVKLGNSLLSYSDDDSSVLIQLPTALTAGQQQTISVYYEGTPIQMAGDFGGFYWTSQYAFNIGVSFLADPHNYGKVWFPCFDNFVERCTYSFAITTDSTRRAICNGTMTGQSTDPLTHHKTWNWSMSSEIPSYLTSVTVSDYAVLADTFAGMGGIKPILLAARAADTSKLKSSFVHLKNALSIFENRFGPYEFERVGYCVVPFNAGAMEHATNISYMQALVNGNTSYENYMAHELSHHWFGDLVTCDNAGDMWLNEGWARYCESVFYEGMKGHEEYKEEVRENHADVIRFAHVADSAYWAVSGVPTQLTYSNYTVYSKGADRVHTLRGYLGDSLFFIAVKSYLQHYKFQDVNSDKLRDYLRTYTGRSYMNDFFADWVHDGGYPDFAIEDKRVSGAGNNYTVQLSIRQRLNHCSHYYTNVPIEVTYFDAQGNSAAQSVSVSGSCTQVSTTLPFTPAYMALDFDEKLSDAVTDEWCKVSGYNVSRDLHSAFIKLTDIHSTDTSLVRVEHHWVAPDATKNLNNGIHLSDYRYWNIDGIWASDFTAEAVLTYNGTKNNGTGYLDNTFITKSEDSLVVMYRPDAQSYWQIESDVTWNRGSLLDKVGSVTINNLQKGQYCLGIYDVNKVDSPQALQASACYPLAVAVTPDISNTFKAYPNPVHNEELNIELEGDVEFKKCVIINMIGEKVMDRDLRDGQNKFMVYMNGLPRGTYIISLIDKDNKSISKTIVKAN